MLRIHNCKVYQEKAEQSDTNMWNRWLSANLCKLFYAIYIFIYTAHVRKYMYYMSVECNASLSYEKMQSIFMNSLKSEKGNKVNSVR